MKRATWQVIVIAGAVILAPGSLCAQMNGGYPQPTNNNFPPPAVPNQPNLGAYQPNAGQYQPNHGAYQQPTGQYQPNGGWQAQPAYNQNAMPVQGNQYPLPAPVSNQRPPAGAYQNQPATNGYQQSPAAGLWADYQPNGAGPMPGNGAMLQEMPYLDEPPAFPYSSGTWWRNGCWYGGLDVAVWHRTRPREKVLGRDISGGPNDTLNAAGAGLGVQAGGRGTLGYILSRDLDNRDHSFEVNYLGFNNWHAVDSLDANLPNSLFVPWAPTYGGFNAADIYATNYHSSFQSCELNYRIRNRPGRDRMIMGPDGFWSRAVTPGRTQSLLLGMRGISVDEDFIWLSRRIGVSPDVFGGDLNLHGDNTLLGLQTGGDYIDVHDGWWWGVEGKAGIFVNFARGSLDVVVNDPQDPEPPIHNRASDQTAAFFGELSFMAGYNLTNNILLRASYDLALIGGIIVAPEDVSADNNLAATPPTLDIDGQIFYNGLSLGFEVYW